MTTAPVTGLRTQRFLLHPEAAYGTAEAVIATRLNGIGVAVTSNPAVEAYAPQGIALPTTGIVTDDTTNLAFTGKLSFSDIVFPFSGLLGPAVITTPGGIAYQWQWTWNGVDVLNAQSFSLTYGDAALAYRIAGALFNGLSFGIARDGNLQMTANGFGKQLEPDIVAYPRESQFSLAVTATGGTYDLVWQGQTAAAIAFNANAAAILAALNALSNVAPGDVTVTGDTSPHLIKATSTGAFAGTDVTASVVTTGLTGGTATLTETQVGGPVVSIPAVPMSPLMFDVFVDNSWANLGNTQVGSIYQVDTAFGDRWARARPLAADQSFDGYTEAQGDASGQNHTCNLIYAANADGKAKLAEARAGTKSFVRIEANGAANSIDTGHAYLFRVDFCHLITALGQFGAVQGGVHSLPVNGRFAADDATDHALQVTVMNAVPSLTGA